MYMSTAEDAGVVSRIYTSFVFAVLLNRQDVNSIMFSFQTLCSIGALQSQTAFAEWANNCSTTKGTQWLKY